MDQFSNTSVKRVLAYKLSPSFKHDKLENYSFCDLVDVFEDMWKKLVFDQAKLLLEHENGELAAMSILMPYFELIEGYISGESSKYKSKEFFVKGFCRVFAADHNGIEKVAKELYINIRCALIHEGFLRPIVNYTRECDNAFYCTYPKKNDGTLELDSDCDSVVVNPVRFYECILLHFNKFVTELRNENSIQLRQNFRSLAVKLWDVNGRDNTIGMTEDEFFEKTQM